jgi:hypothetical protein
MAKICKNMICGTKNAAKAKNRDFLGKKVKTMDQVSS